MAHLAKSKKIRGVHRGYLKKIFGPASRVLQDFKDQGRNEASQIREGILDCLKNLQKFILVNCKRRSIN